MFAMPERIRSAAAACVLAVLCAGSPVLAEEADAMPWPRPDAVFAQLGSGENVDSIAIGATWDWAWRRHYPVGLLTGYTEVSLGRWVATRGDDEYFTQLGVTPVLRPYPGGSAAGWFAEGGIGANAISPRYQNGTHTFSTIFNFGDHIAVGRRFGDRSEHEIALRVQHFSNCGIRKPNPGENFVQLRYVQHF
jgi:lipid A 3-O-deacylase